MLSMVQSCRILERDKVDYAVYALANEALINRGRNTIANLALRDGWDKLLFIDADIGWTTDDLVRILNSDKPLIGGTYPMKAFPISLNFNTMPDHNDVFEATEADGTKIYRKTFDKMALYREKYANKVTGEVQVMHIPTGFMCINVQQVLGALRGKVAEYDHYDYYTGKKQVMYDFFPTGVYNRMLESEDWAFSRLVGEMGIPVYLNTNVVLTHNGNYTFTNENPRLV
jgi:hypothetical protein